MAKKVCFFDMDGTLIDSMQLAWDKVILRFLNERGIKYPDDIITNLVTRGFMGIAKHYVEEFKVDMTPEEIYDWFMVELEPMYQNEFPLKDGAKEFILSLKKQGHVVNVISGSPLRFVVPCFKRTEIYDLFDNVLSLEEFGLTKSDKALFTKLAKISSVSPSDCVVIDDNNRFYEFVSALSVFLLKMVLLFVFSVSLPCLKPRFIFVFPDFPRFLPPYVVATIFYIQPDSATPIPQTVFFHLASGS